MKEIEILVEIYETEEKMIDILQQFTFINEKRVLDIYYYDPLRNQLKPNKNNRINQCFRLRIADGNSTLAYKMDKFDDGDIWLYSDEYETSIEDSKQAQNIIKNLGMEELVKIDNKKKIYKYNEYEITFENVNLLGLFLEVEYCTDEDVDVKKIKHEIQTFIDNLNIKTSRELNMGKPEMMLKKSNFVIE